MSESAQSTVSRTVSHRSCRRHPALPAAKPNLSGIAVMCRHDTNVALDDVRRRPPTLSALDRMFCPSVCSARRSQPCQIGRLGWPGVRFKLGIRQSPRHRINAPIFIDWVPGMPWRGPCQVRLIANLDLVARL
jgi:hypothetical protein